MVHFEGDKDLPQAPTELWTKLSDARFLVQCVPDVQSMGQAEAATATCVVRPGFAFVRGTLEVTLSIVEAVAGASVRVLARSKGIGSSSAVEAALDFALVGQGTRVHWTADVKELGGLLKAVPQGLIKAAAQKVIADVWSRVEAQLTR
jgi:carbon monoxide dehydrogenase subunit G